VDSGQDIEILSNFGFGFSDATDRFVQMIERGGATVRIQVANCGDGLIDVSPAMKRVVSFLKRPNFAANSFNPSCRDR